MGEAGPSGEWGWETLVKEHRWDDVVNWWMRWYFHSPDEAAPLQGLFDALCALVPTICEENGMERRERHLTPTDDPKHWRGQEHLKGAAAILDLGELQAAIEGEPPIASEEWRDARERTEAFLQECLDGEEFTQGAEDISRKAHARKARDLFLNIDNTTAFYISQMDSEEDRDWLMEALADIAHDAFEAGLRTQAAGGKEVEKLAVAREKQIRGFANNSARNRERKAAAMAWREHARLVERALSRNLSDSAKADVILKNWNKVGVEGQRPSPPSKKTLQNWLSHRRKCPAHVGVREI